MGMVEYKMNNQLTAAACAGELNSVKELHQRGARITESAGDQAAYNGHTKVLNYLHQNGCHLTEDMLFNAASNGHLSAVKYLIRNGVVPELYMSKCAYLNKNHEIAEYLKNLGCDWMAD